MDVSKKTWLRPLITSFTVFGALGLSALPYYGYIVVANEFDQWVFLVFLGSWMAAIGLAVAGFVIALVYRKRLGVYSLLLAVLGVVLLVSAAFGFGGVRRAFFEMVAG